MHCASCEVLIERQWKKLPGVNDVKVYHAKGYAEIYCENLNLKELDSAIQEHGYQIKGDGSLRPRTPEKYSPKDYLEIGAIFLILLGVYLLSSKLNLLPKGVGISEGMGLGVVFVIGLVAAISSCIAVTGGLLLAVAAKYNEKNPEGSGYQKFRPHLFFNAGRIASYTFFGGAIGAVGSFIAFSPFMTGLLSLFASIVMIVLGIQILKLFPAASKLHIRMPKKLAHAIHNLSEKNHPLAPFLLGAGTFFLPCGFTQGLQLYVLTRGNWLEGALIMLVFSLGTLPALLSLSVLSSFAKGKFQKYFLKFSGTLVLLLGIYNISSSLNLLGVNTDFTFTQNAGAITSSDPNVVIEGNKQIVKMKVDKIDYVPLQFTVYKDMPVVWEVDGREAVGCTQVITIPKLGITRYLSPNEITTITFTPDKTGDIKFSCSMGMTDSRAKFIVIENPNTQELKKNPEPAGAPSCDPKISNCVSLQKIKMEISRERGFYPNILTVKKGIPVEWDIDTQVPMGGCMGVLVIPEYNIAHRLALGETRLQFTPNKTGVYPFTCSMGAKLGEITVIN